MAWTSPRTWVALEDLTAANFNTHVRDNLKAIGDAWTAYTPTWTASSVNPAIGNGTIAGSYLSAGKLTLFKITVSMGSTTTYGTGSYSFSLPVTAALSGLGANFPVGQAHLRDSSPAANYFRQAVLAVTGTTVVLYDQAGTAAATTVPFTWANGDSLAIMGCFEAA